MQDEIHIINAGLLDMIFSKENYWTVKRETNEMSN